MKKPGSAIVFAAVVVVILGHCCSRTTTAAEAVYVCNVDGFHSAEPWDVAKANLLLKLTYNTFWLPDHSYWTNYTAGVITFFYGYASCATTMVCDGGSRQSADCSTTYDHCVKCLNDANYYLTTSCYGRIGGHVTNNNGVLQCYMRYEQTQFQ
ncbi:unnamed protein product [Linum trigynum]|uniref:Gnk2-homologous domain-containing protein n=1 Tax=Linum trigynum TaxID=586398 RepID=A0AAV2FPC1_9ROSI